MPSVLVRERSEKSSHRSKRMFKARAGSIFSDDDAKIIGAELLRIGKSVDGNGKVRVTTDSILDAARSPRSSLHPYFDWNDTVAAEKWRKRQAREVVNNIIVVEFTSHGQIQYRAFENVNVNIGDASEAERSYVSVEDGMEYLRREGKERLADWVEDFSVVPEFHAVVRAAAGVLE